MSEFSRLFFQERRNGLIARDFINSPGACDLHVKDFVEDGGGHLGREAFDMNAFFGPALLLGSIDNRILPPIDTADKELHVFGLIRENGRWVSN